MVLSTEHGMDDPTMFGAFDRSHPWSMFFLWNKFPFLFMAACPSPSSSKIAPMENLPVDWLVFGHLFVAQLRFPPFFSRHVTADKFYIEPTDTIEREVLVIDRISQEISLHSESLPCVQFPLHLLSLTVSVCSSSFPREWRPYPKECWGQEHLWPVWHHPSPCRYFFNPLCSLVKKCGNWITCMFWNEDLSCNV